MPIVALSWSVVLEKISKALLGARLSGYGDVIPNVIILYIEINMKNITLYLIILLTVFFLLRDEKKPSKTRKIITIKNPQKKPKPLFKSNKIKIKKEAKEQEIEEQLTPMEICRGEFSYLSVKTCLVAHSSCVKKYLSSGRSLSSCNDLSGDRFDDCQREEFENLSEYHKKTDFVRNCLYEYEGEKVKI